MTSDIIAKRYADAFVRHAKETIGIPQAIDELKNFKWVLDENPALEKFLRNPGITLSEKYECLENILKTEFSPQLKNFLKLLLVKKHIDFIVPIADYIRLTYSHTDAIDVLLKTTYPLELDLIRDLKQKIEKKFQKKVNLYWDLAPELLGGVQIISGNVVIDASLKRRLENLRQELKK